jgi:hypothetical protein
MHNKSISKINQLKAYKNSGLPFPSATLFHWGQKLDREIFGDIVVIKPIDPRVSSHGNVWIRERADVEAFRPEQFPPESMLKQWQCLVQQFIDTGSNPVSNRVTCFCQEVVLAYEMKLKKSVDLEVSLEEQNIATNGAERDRRLFYDADVINLARKAARCFPFIPLQGIDIVREADAGRLYVLESNCGGNVWHFSSRMAAPMRKHKGVSRMELLNQFSAYDTAAKALIKAARALAE